MNCSNCNIPLLPESNGLCPICGMQNIVNNTQVSQVQEQIGVNNEVETLEEPSATITADMLPPELNIEGSNLAEGVTDISAANVSTYSPEQAAEEKQEQEEQMNLEQNRVDIAIPSVQQPVDVANVNVDENGVPIVETNGEIKPTTEEQAKKIKLPSIKLPSSIKIGNKDIKIPDISKGKPMSSSLAIIGFVVCFIVGLIAGNLFFSKSVYVPGTYNNKNSDEIVRVADGKNNVTKAGAFTFTIPEVYYYDRRDGGVAIFDEKDTFRIFMRAVPGSYTDLATAQKSVSETIKAQSVTVVSIAETTVEKKEYLVVETTKGMYNRLLAFTNAGNDYVFYIEIVAYDNTYDYNALDLANEIAVNTKYNDKESEMEKIDTNDISEVVVKASQEYKELTN